MSVYLIQLIYYYSVGIYFCFFTKWRMPGQPRCAVRVPWCRVCGAACRGGSPQQAGTAPMRGADSCSRGASRSGESPLGLGCSPDASALAIAATCHAFLLPAPVRCHLGTSRALSQLVTGLLSEQADRRPPSSVTIKLQVTLSQNSEKNMLSKVRMGLQHFFL